MRMRWVLVLSSLLLASSWLVAQSPNATPGYLIPPKSVLDILDAEPLPTVSISPARDVIALVSRRSMPSIAEVSEPMLRLAGIRISPRTNGPRFAPTGTGITLRTIATGTEQKIAVPSGAKIGSVSFSPDGKRLSFTNTLDTRIELYLADVASAQTRRVDAVAINGVSGGCSWLDDSTALICGLVPSGRGPQPVEPRVPRSPNIQENFGKAGAIRTYEDMLTSPYDEDLYEYYFTNQRALIDAATGRVTAIGKPGLIASADVSPNGQYIIVETVKRPFSYLLPWSGFPSDIDVWNRRGEKVRTIADVPMSDVIPINGVTTGPRGLRWHPLEGARLVWVEALDKGDLKNKVPNRDRLMSLNAPFTGEPSELIKTEYRFSGVSWTEGGSILLSESNRDTRTTRTWVFNATWGDRRKVWDRKQQDSYGNPGQPLFRPGKGVVMQVGDVIYLTGAGASPQGDRPFLDRLNLKTLATDRLFRSDMVSYESVIGLLGDDAKRVLTRYETKTQPPNYFVRDLAANSRQPITAFKDPHPQITAAERTFVTYRRKDGVGLSGTLYVPPGHRTGERLPMFVWAYPQEFTDTNSASQVVGSPNRFTFVTGASQLLLLTQGYAVFDGPTMPIVGEGETANNTYVDQLVSSAQAAVDKAVEMGVADRNRVAVGGHSYGAFMTANLLAHSDIFAAGVARSGAYNRSLTPFGFQNESRTFWEAPDVYGKMSPFNYADKVNEPILLIHGEADDNSGTFPIQSERFYMALKGHGATVRYVTLPNEAHGYAARETNLHVMAETLNWLDKYVKNRAVPAGTTSSR